MGGLARLCKMYGQIDCTDSYGNKVIWLWDYVLDKPRLKSEMSKEEIAASEKVKWESVKNQINNNFKKSDNENNL
jgi:hypothetical protein